MVPPHPSLHPKGDAASALNSFGKALTLDPAIPHFEKSTVLRARATAAKLRPKDGGYRYRLGAALNGVGHYQDAARELSDAVKLLPKNAAVWNELGLAQQKSGGLAHAVDTYRRAVDLDPANADARNNLGLMLVNTREPEAAIAQFQKVRVLRLKGDIEG